jgi:hypothetical protein
MGRIMTPAIQVHTDGVNVSIIFININLISGGTGMKIVVFGRKINLVLIILSILILFVAGLVLGSIDAGKRVQAAEPSTNTPVSVDQATLIDCAIGNIAVFPNRIHVFCSNAATNPKYFAASGDSAHALTTNRYLTLLNTAYALGKHAEIWYYDDTDLNPPGCNINDCRAIYWIFLVP